jgi:hypothetical protein
MADDLTEAIQQNAQGPASAEADGVKLQQHGLPRALFASQGAANRRKTGPFRSG